jgi:D-beta-D-heptose 7-phosphate kinase/D-beta-D-heptose 1-phosphate adenosyltransferase
MGFGEIIANAHPSQRILVVGDIMLDRYVYGHAERISPEAPVTVLTTQSQDQMPGGAANVAVNIAALDTECTLIGLVGDDPEADLLKHELGAWAKISVQTVVDASRPTTLKTRFVSSRHHTHLLRVDRESSKPTSSEISAKIQSLADNQLGRCAILVLSDYGKGTLTDATIRFLVERAREHEIPILVDPKGADLARYRGAALITPNLAELSTATGRSVPQDDGAVEAAAGALSRETGIARILVKRHEDGVHLVESGRTSMRVPALARAVTDVSGAGDTILSALAVALSAGADLRDAVRWANAAAAVVVAKRGTAAPTRPEIEACLRRDARGAPSPKMIADLAELADRVQAWRLAGLTVGLTNGCFDLLHAGHVALIEEAGTRVDRLIVAMNSDASIKALKGPTRPIIDAVSRARMITALEAVDALVVFEDPTPLAVIETARPDLLFKGSDYALEEVVGRAGVEAQGGRVVLIERQPDISTTSIIRRIVAD